ncbi:potassium-transporting ATPase subunit C, partial [Salmonella sp. SAL04269]
DYATVSSAASNLAPSNPALAERIARDAAQERIADQGPVPLALVTTSGSGLDPQLPPQAARYQALRVATARGLPLRLVEDLVESHT